MAKLFQNPDGADEQARAVLAYLSSNQIEMSWNRELQRHEAEPEVNRWHNGRERGYVITLRDPLRSGDLQIAFFEHRNSDEICAVEWRQTVLNPPTISDLLKTDNPYVSDKYAVSHREEVGRAYEMAEWILGRLVAFWSERTALKACEA